jgi:hypothetical protein
LIVHHNIAKSTPQADAVNTITTYRLSESNECPLIRKRIVPHLAYNTMHITAQWRQSPRAAAAE